ncbi:unnamed protein product [marine sediment metagenome]|uniref:Uncharacterized protein n=1 Tax=marine sediment metagenome TaxID=412755 RepID=X1VB79_9ZZZZ
MSQLDTMTDERLTKAGVALWRLSMGLNDLLITVSFASLGKEKVFQKHLLSELTLLGKQVRLARDYLDGKLPYNPT